MGRAGTRPGIKGETETTFDKNLVELGERGDLGRGSESIWLCGH